MLEQGLLIRVKNDAAVNALIAGRFFPLVIPQDADMPSAKYDLIDGESDHDLDGPTGLKRTLIQVASYSDKGTSAYAEARELDAAIASVLDGLRGVLHDPDVTRVDSARRMGGPRVAPFEIDQPKRRGIMSDYEFWHT